LVITAGTYPFRISSTTAAKLANTIFRYGLLQGNLPVVVGYCGFCFQ